MKIGLQIPNFTLPGGPPKLAEHLARVARDADQAGFASLWVMDHWFQIEFIGPPEMDMHEAYTTLGFLAAHTQKVRLGTMVTGITYRYPGLLAKTVTTLDVLSGGRAWFGVGAGWFEREHQGLGVPFPPVAERFERLEEALQIALQMWSSNNGPYHGKHYRLEETLCVPQPLSRPHPPILIGGMGEQKTLRMVAQYAQACNLFEFAGVDEIKGKLAVLREHCQRLNRPYGEIEKTTLGSFRSSREELGKYLEHLHRLAELGIDQAILNMPDVTDAKAFELLAGEVVPAAAKIQAAAVS